MQHKNWHLFAVATLALCGAVATPARAQHKPTVAVFEIEARRVRLARGVLGLLSGYVADRMASSTAFQLVPRDKLKKKLAAQKTRANKRCHSRTCQIKIGKQLAAHRSLSTRLVKIGSRCVVTGTLYDLQRGAADQGATAEGKCSEDGIMASIKAVVTQLAGGAQGAAAPAPSPAAPPAATTPPPVSAAPPGTHLCNTNKLDDCKKQCELGHAGSCSNLGFMYSQGKGVKKNAKRAAALYLQACKGGHMHGCFNLGVLHESGRGVTKDLVRAAKLYAKGCNGGDMDACFNLGMSYENGEGVPRNPAKSATLYTKGCKGGDMHSCGNLGYLLEKGRGIKKDLSRAAALYLKACEGGRLRSCSNLGIMYEKGQGMPKNYDKAVTLYHKSCDGGHMHGCYCLADMYEYGKGVTKDMDRAIELYQKACGKGHDGSCRYLKKIAASVGIGER